MATALNVFGGEEEKRLLALARELAMDIIPVETILKAHSITAKDLENYLKHPRFRAMYEEAKIAWSSATNTAERIKLKQLAVVEEAIPEMWRFLHDTQQAGSARVELYKTMMKGAGVGLVDAVTDVGNKVQITINLGEKTVAKEAELPLIEGEVVDG